MDILLQIKNQLILLDIELEKHFLNIQKKNKKRKIFIIKIFLGKYMIKIIQTQKLNNINNFSKYLRSIKKYRHIHFN